MRTIITILTVFLSAQCSIAQELSLEKKVNSFIRNAVPLIGVSEIKAWPNATILDARKEHEYEVSHLPNAIYLGECPHHLEPIAQLAMTDTIIVYCTVGYRSENLGEQLMELGYENVFNLFGGIFIWKNSGEIVVDGSGKFTESVHTHTQGWSQFLNKGKAIY